MKYLNYKKGLQQPEGLPVSKKEVNYKYFQKNKLLYNVLLKTFSLNQYDT